MAEVHSLSDLLPPSEGLGQTLWGLHLQQIEHGGSLMVEEEKEYTPSELGKQLKKGIGQKVIAFVLILIVPFGLSGNRDADVIGAEDAIEEELSCGGPSPPRCTRQRPSTAKGPLWRRLDARASPRVGI